MNELRIRKGIEWNGMKEKKLLNYEINKYILMSVLEKHF